MGSDAAGLKQTDSIAQHQGDKGGRSDLNSLQILAGADTKGKQVQPDSVTQYGFPNVQIQASEAPAATRNKPESGQEIHGNTTVKKDASGKTTEYDSGEYTLAKHDDGKWFYHQNGDGHAFVEVDGKSIKMDEQGKVRYNENGFFGKHNQTLGNGSTGLLDSITSGALNGAKDVALSSEGLFEGVANGAIDTFDHFSKEAHDGWHLPNLHISDVTLPNQAEVDNSAGGKIGKFVGGLPSKVTESLGDTVVDLGKATYHFDGMMIGDATTIAHDARYDRSELGADFVQVAQQSDDFQKGVIQGIALDPINGMEHLEGKILGVSNDQINRAQLHLVTKEYQDSHPAAKMGDVTGQVALQVGIAVATDGIGDALAPTLAAGERAGSVAAGLDTGAAEAAETGVTQATEKGAVSAAEKDAGAIRDGDTVEAPKAKGGNDGDYLPPKGRTWDPEVLKAKINSLKQDLGINWWTPKSVQKDILLKDLDQAPRIKISRTGENVTISDGNTRYALAKQLGIPDSEIPVWGGPNWTVKEFLR